MSELNNIYLIRGFTLYDNRYNQEVQVISVKRNNEVWLTTDIREWKDSTRYCVDLPLDDERFTLEGE
jgi:hypothetical protein